MKDKYLFVFIMAISLVGFLTGICCVLANWHIEGYVVIIVSVTIYLVTAVWYWIEYLRTSNKKVSERGVCYVKYKAVLRCKDEFVRDGYLTMYANGIGYTSGDTDLWDFIPLKDIKDVIVPNNTMSLTYWKDNLIKNIIVVFEDDIQAREALVYINQEG